MVPSLPLAGWADRRLKTLAESADAAGLRALSGAGLLTERAALAGHRIPDTISAGGGCRLYPAGGGTVALNLSRPSDIDLLPALFEVEDAEWGPEVLARHMAGRDSLAITLRGRELGLAIAAEEERAQPRSSAYIFPTLRQPSPRRPPLVVDLSALWAGPLAAQLLGLAGARVIKVESLSRPDAMRTGEPGFFALLNQGKASVALDFAAAEGRAKLTRLLCAADIVIEAARPRALLQFGIDAERILGNRPGQVWISITAHGVRGDAANWIGFGDDAGVAAGLTAALREATGEAGFVGDAIADPLTGIQAALTAWSAWTTGLGGRHVLAMSEVAALALAESRADDPSGLLSALRSWRAAVGHPLSSSDIRHAAPVAPFGRDTKSCLEMIATC